MPRLGDLEAAIMECAWAAGRPLLVRELLEGIGRPLAYNTVHTVTENLYRKGRLSKARDGRAYRYAPVEGKAAYIGGLVAEALSIADDRSSALVGLVEGITPAEAAELRRLLDEAVQKEARP